MERFADHMVTSLLEAAPDAMVCVDGTGRIILANAQAEQLFGYSRDDLVGQLIEILVPETVRHAHLAQRAGYMAKPRRRPMGIGMDLSARRKDGTTFPAEISLSATHTGEGVVVTAAIRDITERLQAQAERERLTAQAERDRLERQLQQSRRLESLGQLAGGVAHDFNNLLGVISSYTSIVTEELSTPPAPGDWQAIHADLGQIQQATQCAAALTRQLLAFARQEVIKPQPLNLNDIVTQIQQLLTRTLGEHIELSTDPGPGLRAVMADPGQIEQVLINLAVNARDAMPGGGHLAVATANLDITGQQAPEPADLAPGHYVTLTVSDTGTGIPKAIIHRVFEPFFTTKPEGIGTGLGLAAVYGIITQAGGHLTIRSEAGLGTTVTALLPATSQTAATAAPPPSQPDRGAGQTVLLVEDEAALREATQRILTRNGYHVFTAANGPQALTLLDHHPGPVHLLLTDVVMPHMPGEELAGKVQAIRPDIRVLFMSGYTQGLLGAQGVLEPGIHLIEKPFDQAALLTKLTELLGTRS